MSVEWTLDELIWLLGPVHRFSPVESGQSVPRTALSPTATLFPTVGSSYFSISRVERKRAVGNRARTPPGPYMYVPRALLDESDVLKRHLNILFGCSGYDAS